MSASFSVMALLLLAGAKGRDFLPQLKAKSALLTEQRTGTVLFSLRPGRRMYPASLTKLLTALVVLRNLRDLSEPVVVSREASQTPGSSAALEEGERITVKELLEAALVRSANDACVALAEHLCGSVEKFVSLMNEEAKAIGCKGSLFLNPHGLHHPGHFSCALDLALIAREAMKEPFLRRVARKKFVAIESLDGKRRVYESRNKLLWRYKWAEGIKTGYTSQAGKCLIGSASREGMRLIAVVLNSPSPFSDGQTLLEWGFSRFRLVRLVREGKVLAEAEVEGGRPGKIPLAAAEDGFAVLPKRGGKGRVALMVGRLNPPVHKGDVVGEALCLGVGRMSIPLVALSTSLPSPWWRRNGWLWALLVALSGFLALLVMVKAKKRVE